MLLGENATNTFVNRVHLSHKLSFIGALLLIGASVTFPGDFIDPDLFLHLESAVPCDWTNPNICCTFSRTFDSFTVTEIDVNASRGCKGKKGQGMAVGVGGVGNGNNPPPTILWEGGGEWE